LRKKIKEKKERANTANMKKSKREETRNSTSCIRATHFLLSRVLGYA
jgi:hypothetical protein